MKMGGVWAMEIKIVGRENFPDPKGPDPRVIMVLMEIIIRHYTLPQEDSGVWLPIWPLRLPQGPIKHLGPPGPDEQPVYVLALRPTSDLATPLVL